MENLVQVVNEQVVVSSRQVAESFRKRHDNVLRSIEEILEGKNSAFINMFIETEYKANDNGRNYKEYLMNRDGFSLLVMGFTGKQAIEWKTNIDYYWDKLTKEYKGSAEDMENVLVDNFNLKVIDGKVYADSRQVAAMVGKRHDHLIRDIDGYVRIINQTPDLGTDNFFAESSYQSGTGKSYKCYLLTKKGCDMVANKMTGEKGILFTATYIDKFYEMEQRLNKPMSQLEIIAASAQALLNHERKLAEIASQQNKLTTQINTACEIMKVRPDDWRRETKALLDKISETGISYSDVRNESYSLLESRFHCDLDRRLKNMKVEARKAGTNKTNVDKINKLDVIATDKKLIEGYISVVKDMAVSYCTTVIAS